MKKPITLLVAFLLFANYSCKEKIDYNKEKQAIMAVVEEETAAYYAQDYNHWCATYLQDSSFMYSSAYKSGTFYLPGWKGYSLYMKSTILDKKDFQKEIKTPLRIKVYGESAWVVFDNESQDNKGVVSNRTVSCFLEKNEGKWRVVYRNVIFDDSYYEPDFFLLNSLSFAKSIGQKTEALASFYGDQVKSSWTGGYKELVEGMLYGWGILVPKKELKIIEQDSSHVIFSVNMLFPGLKTAPQNNVTYEDFLNAYNIICGKVADHLGATYKQETTDNGVKITISKK